MARIPQRDKKGREVLRIQNLADDENLRVRHKGIMDGTINAGQSLDIDYKMEQLQWMGQDKPSVMVGVSFKVIGGNDGDNLDFCIIDKDNVLGFGAGAVLDQFADSFYIFKDEPIEIREHKADLIPNVYIRAHYNNTGAASARFICNILRYVDTE